MVSAPVGTAHGDFGTDVALAALPMSPTPAHIEAAHSAAPTPSQGDEELEPDKATDPTEGGPVAPSSVD